MTKERTSVYIPDELLRHFTPKEVVINQVRTLIRQCQLRVAEEDIARPWGGFFRFDEASLPAFLKRFFPEYTSDNDLPLSPKLLVIAPHTALSLQYHHRRSEIWKVLAGSAGVVLSETDDVIVPYQTYRAGETIVIPQGKRHRGIGINSWGIIAEIWEHTVPDEPSSEDDIVRIHDYYGRT